MKNIFKKIGYGLLVFLLIIQFFRPTENKATTAATNHISKLYPVPYNVEQIFITACYDCHSNNTNYPWYSKVQPVAWWLNDHIQDGKRHFNFDEFAAYRVAKQNHKLEELIGEVSEGEMPMESYTLIHQNAKLTDAQKQAIVLWATAVRDTIKNRFPADSLVLPKKKK